jgi:transcription elongation factor SPT5
VVSGVQEGATGLVIKVEGHALIILSDTTKAHVSYFGPDICQNLLSAKICQCASTSSHVPMFLQIRVFADYAVESSEVTTGITRIGDYELHDLVLVK